ncbi:MAG TPA: EAL domain-containing protein [Acetobacteraceae bacterium]|nr:EAL domain-containing protein [Acetobacteraceae bacterium]
MAILTPLGSLGGRSQGEAATAKVTKRHTEGRVVALTYVMPELAAILGLTALVWVSIAMLLVRERQHAVDAARNTSTMLATAFEESTKRIITEIDQTLLSARESYLLQGDQFDIGQWAGSMVRSDELRGQIALMDRDGNDVRSTLERSNQRQASIADRPQFRAQLDASHDDLYISDPVVGRGNGRRTIQFTRKALDKDGKFNGVFVLSLNCAQLSAFFDTSQIGDGFVALFNANGILLARGPGGAADIGRNFAADPGFRLLDDDHAATSWSEASPDARRIVSYHRVNGYPLIIAVGFGKNKTFRRYWYSAAHFVETGVVATAVIILLGAFWIRQRRHTLANGYALTVTLRNMNQGIALVDPNGNTPVINERALQLLEMSGHDGSTAVADRLRQSIESSGGDAEQGADADHLTVKSIRADGRVIELHRTQLRDGGAIHTLTDVTERHKAEERIRYLAHNDLLTGLPNRVLLEDSFAALRDRAAATRQQMLTLFIDLDGFKGVNDTLGHLVGDRLLAHVAQQIRSLAEGSDFVARLGGDEFVFLAARADVESGTNLAHRIIERIATPMNLNGHDIRIAASVGVSVFPQDGGDRETLFRKADIALYRAKAEGRARCVVFEQSMDDLVQRRVLLEKDLRNALGTAQMHVHYQAKFDAAQLKLVGFEALVRWDHPQHGWVSPSAFIPVAEECRLIGRLGTWMLEQACREATQWPATCHIAVNVSPLQLHDPDFAATVRGILQRTGLSPHRLELEITESVMSDDNDMTLATMASLRAMGVTFALDDFGTGYSSLSNLLRFQFDAVKIDKCFVQSQATDAEARAIVEAIIVMSRHIGLTVTAEGVETEDQLALLRQQGCPLVQGYLVGAPMPGWQVPGRFKLRRTGIEADGERELAGD